MRLLEPKSALFKEVYSHGFSAAVGTFLLGAVLAYEIGLHKIQSNVAIQIALGIIWIASISRFAMSAYITHRVTKRNMPPTKGCEVSYGLSAIIGGVGFCTIAVVLNARYGFSNIDSVLSLISVCAVSTAATTSLGGSRWMAQAFLAITLFKLSFFFMFESGLHTLGLMTMIYYAYLARYAEIYYRQLSERFHYQAELEKEQIAQRESQSRLIQSAKMASLGEMAGGISHEINNPLAIIVGKTDVLLDRLARGPVATDVLVKDLAKLKDTAFRISRIIRGLRAFSRSGENDPLSRSLVTPLIEDSLELCKERFRNRSVDLRVNLSVECEIMCRPSQVSQVVLNLLNNAFDAIQSSDQPWIEVKTEMRATGPAIVVTDSGAGIPEEIASRLMEPFFTTKPVNQGTGLGLSISKGLIEDHGGKLTYDATCSNTRFVVEFPHPAAVKPNAKAKAAA